MNLTVNSTLGSFLLAVLVYFLFNVVIDTFITEPNANKMFKLLLLIVCLLIALGGSLFLKI